MWAQYIYDENNVVSSATWTHGSHCSIYKYMKKIVVVCSATWTHDPFFYCNIRRYIQSYVCYVDPTDQLINHNM